MIEFSEIFKDNQGDKSKDEQKRQVDFSSLPLEAQKSRPPKEDLSGGARPNKDAARAQTKKLYEQLLAVAEAIMQKRPDAHGYEAACGASKLIVENLRAYDQELIEQLLHGSGSDYRLSHNCAHVAVLALKIGIEMNMGERELTRLGVAAFFHDLGMAEHAPLCAQKRKLSVSEFQQIKNHCVAGATALTEVALGIDPEIVKVLEQEHERMQGSGYPRGLSKADIGLFARIVGFADVYEALTHVRPYREAYSPFKAVKIMLKDKELFDTAVVKLFLEKIGLYPQGTPVKLNTKEVARVVSHNPRYPMAPVVVVTGDAQGKPVLEPREIDLSTKATLYITECL